MTEQQQRFERAMIRAGKAPTLFLKNKNGQYRHKQAKVYWHIWKLAQQDMETINNES